MPRRPTRPFAVEVRSSRKRLLHPAAFIAGVGDKGFPADDLPNGKPHGSALDGLSVPRVLRQHLVQPTEASAQAPVVEASTPEPQPLAEATAKPRGRILPDLQAEDPVEAALRRVVEERAPRPRGRPKGSRNRPKLQTPQAALRLDEGQIAQHRAVLRQTAPAAGTPVETSDKPVLVEAVGPEPISAHPAEARMLSRAVTRTFSRRAKRRGEPVRLPPGERWKRRLPKALW